MVSPVFVQRASPLVLLAVLTVFLGGCGPTGSQQVGFLDAPFLNVMSSSGALTLAVFSNPQPPVRGNLSFKYVITDAAGLPVDGLKLEVVPWMPSMGHGTRVVPTTQAKGEGRYELTNVYLYMPGQWQLRTAITGGPTDSATPDFMVQ